jgi:hypothetical protein
MTLSGLLVSSRSRTRRTRRSRTSSAARPHRATSVNIKTYSRHESVLDISPHSSDCYLVLTGPAGQARVLPWVNDSVLLFNSEQLLATLTTRGIKIGIATSVRKQDWEAARIYPPQPISQLQLSSAQIARLELFTTTHAAAND